MSLPLVLREPQDEREGAFAAKVAVAAGVLLAALVVFGCGGGSAAKTPARPSVTPSPVPAPATATPSPSATPEGFEYEVEPGDTVFGIAERFGATADEIVRANGLADPASIAVGQVLRITGATITPTPAPANPAGTGFAFPIRGGCLPQNDDLMPNAPRAYRAGIHEGVDFYGYDNCTEIPAGEPVLAAKAGKVVRADHDFTEMTQAELDEVLARSQRQGYTDEEALDRFRGRQVWIDHGGGVITRYVHLGGIPDDARVGRTVRQGDVIGFAGDSGTPEAVTSPGVEIHLHFEIRTGDSFLGKDLPPDQVRWLYEQVFGGG